MSHAPDPNNFIYRSNPVGKIFALVLIIIILLFFDNFLAYLVVSLFLLSVILFGRIQFSGLFKKVKSLGYFLVLIACCHFFFTPGNSIPPFPVWKFDVTWEGARNGLGISIRFLFLILASSILTITTKPIDLARGFESVFYPLGFLGLPISRFSKMIVLTLQFIPVVFSEGEKSFNEASKDIPGYSSFNLFRKIPLLVSVVESVFLRSLEYARELTEVNGVGQ